MSGRSMLDEARAAVGCGDWQRALDLLEAEDAATRSAEGLELLAHAAYGGGEFERAVAALEDLHALLAADGDDVAAARAAAMVAMYLMMDTGLMAPVRGWLARAERLLRDHDEVPPHALIAMVRTYERFMCGDMAAAREQSARAIDLGTRFGVQPAVVIGRVAQARVTIFEGRVDDGLAMLDEVAVWLMSGEVDPLTTGMMYCELICAAQGLALHDRATEWTEIMERWRHGAAIGGINGRCRVHRAEMLRISGPCDQAEAEALGACEELRPWMRREFGWPLAELGNIRLRRGDLAGAEEAFVEAHEHAWSPHPGLALLRLAQGDVEAAASLIADAIAHPLEVPSKERPPFGDLRLAPLLDAQAEIAAAAGDLDAVATAADALRTIAETYASPSLAAAAALAGARAALLSGDHDAAIRGASDAIVLWTDVGAPFEVATARIVLGEAHRQAGNDAGATIEWRAASAAFEQFGAPTWAERAARLADGRPGTGSDRPPVTAGPSTAGIFSTDGEARTICFRGETVVMRDLKGFRYLARLLAEPGREFHALDLVAIEQGVLRPHGPNARAGDESIGQGIGAVAEGVGSGLPVLDDAARAAYRRRIEEIDDDIEEAERTNDIGRLELARHDREYLIAELSRAVGLGGLGRTIGGSTERARVSVTRSLRYALGRLARHHPLLGAHLDQCVHTGAYCRYQPDPLAPIIWTT